MRLVILLALAFGFCTTGLARAQTFSDTTLPYPERADLITGLSLDLDQGPRTLLHGSVDGLARVALGRHRIELGGSGALGLFDGKRFARHTRGLARYRVTVLSAERPWLSSLRAAALTLYERSEQQRHEHWITLGLGPEVELLEWDKFRLSLMVGYALDQEFFSESSRPDNRQRQLRDSGLGLYAHRALSVLELGLTPTSFLHVGERAVVLVPLTYCACDTKLENNLFLRFFAKDSFVAVQLEMSVLYDPRPALRATQLRTVGRTSLSFRF